MLEAAIIAVDKPSIQVKPGSRQPVSLKVTVRSRAQVIERYRLEIEGIPPGWAMLAPAEVTAFPLREAPARVVFDLPLDAPKANYTVTIRAIPQDHPGEVAQGKFELQVLEAEHAVAPAVTPVGLGTIEVTTQPLDNPTLPPPALQWQVEVKNRGRRLDAFSFCIADAQPVWVSAEPAELALKEDEMGTAILTVYPPDDPTIKTYALTLRTLSHIDPGQRREVRLQGNVRPSGGAGAMGPPKTAQSGQLQLIPEEPSVAIKPGDQDIVVVYILNRSGMALELIVNARGLPQSWMLGGQAIIKLDPDRRGPVALTLAPPLDTPVGIYPFTIHVRASGAQDIDSQISLVLGIGEVGGMPSSISVGVDNAHPIVASSASVGLMVTVQNLTTLLDTAEVKLDGLDSDWWTVTPPILTLFEQQQATASLTIAPPSDPARSLAGTYPITVRATSLTNPSQESRAQVRLEVRRSGSYRLEMGRVEAHDVLEASYPLQIRNDANAALRVHLSASDPDDALTYAFSPAEPHIPAGQEATVLLAVRSRGPADAVRTIGFTVSAQGDFVMMGGVTEVAPPQQVAGRFVHEPPAQLAVSIHPTEITSPPGGQYEIRVSNPRTLPVSVHLSGTEPQGNLDLQFTPSQLALEAGREARSVLVVRPKVQLAPGQRHVNVFRVVATPLEGGIQGGTAEGRFIQVGQVQGFYRLRLGRPEARGILEASYLLQIQNEANAPLRLRLSASDPDNALTYAFVPAEPQIPAGQEVTVILTVTGKGPANVPRSVDFGVSARGDFLLMGGVTDVAPVQQVTARFIHEPPAQRIEVARPAQAYAVMATSRTAALIIYLLDISGSMGTSMGRQRRIDIVMQALDATLRKMVFRSTKGARISPRYRIAMLAYSEDVHDLLGGIQSVDQVALLGTPQLDPGTSTRTAKAFAEAEQLLQAELNRLGDCPAPLVCHMTDGEYNGDDPQPIAQRIMQMAVPDGNVLVENIYISDRALSRPIRDVMRWPGILPDTELASAYATKLRAMSSPLPASYRSTMLDEGYNLASNALMLLPGTSPELVALAFAMSAATPIGR